MLIRLPFEKAIQLLIRFLILEKKQRNGYNKLKLRSLVSTVYIVKYFNFMITLLQNLKATFNSWEVRREFSQYDIDYLQHRFSEDIFKGIYEYRYGSYEWTGLLIATTWSDKWYKIYLGHCSCYGPLENLNNNPVYTKEEILKLIDNLLNHFDWRNYTEEVVQEFRDFVLTNS